MRCPACSARVSEDAEVCGKCGRKLREDDAKKTMMGIPAMGADDPEPEADSEEVSARSTLFGIPAASREASDDTPPPTGPGGAEVRDDATPVPEGYQGEGDARTQVADKDTLTDALRDSGAQQSARSTMFGLPRASKEEDDDSAEDDDIASHWGLGEESDDAENRTMVASGNILEQAVDSDVRGEGTGYSKPQADVDPNVQTLMGMQAEEDGEAYYEDVYADEFEEDFDDPTQALSADELERFEQEIKAQDGFEDPTADLDSARPESEPAQQPAATEEVAATDDTNRRRSLLQKLKRRSEEDGEVDDPRRTAAGLPAAQDGEKKSDFGHDTIDERGGGTGTRFSIPKPGGDKPTASGAASASTEQSRDQDADRERSQTPRSGVLQARKPKAERADRPPNERGMLESSSSYRISGSSDAKLEGRAMPGRDAQGGAGSQGPNTSFPISDSKPNNPTASQQPEAEDKTAVLNDDQIQDIALDDTAAVSEDELAVEPVDDLEQIDEIDDIALAETGVTNPDELQGDFDESRAAAPEQFAQGASTSGVVQPGQRGSGVSQPGMGSGSGVSQPGRESGVIQPGESSGVVHPSENSGVVQPGGGQGLHEPSDGGSGVVQPDAGTLQPADSGIEPPASSTQRGGFGAESTAASGPGAASESQQKQRDSDFNFGATPVGTSTSGSSGDIQAQQQGGFGAANVPNPSEKMGTESPGKQPTRPPGQQADEASSLERKIRVVFAVIGALVTIGAGAAAFAEGVMALPTLEKGIFLSPIAIGLLTLGVGVLPLSSGIKSIGLVLMTLLTGAALAGAIVFEAAPVIMLLLVGGTLLTLCAAAFPALVKLVK
jgi:hypothetical protein